MGTENYFCINSQASEADRKATEDFVYWLISSETGKDYGALMALLVLSVIPIVVFYLFCQKYIIEGVVAGAVKG